MDTLPALIEIPHAGLDIPDETKPHLIYPLIPDQVRTMSDEFALNVYGDQPVVHTVTTPVARCIVNVNALPEDRKPKGIVTHRTIWEEPLYGPDGPPAELTDALVDRYVRPYYQRLHAAVEDEQVRAVFLGHTMMGIHPMSATRKPRPLFTIGTGGNKGEPGPETFVSRQVVSRVTEIIRERIKALDIGGVAFQDDIRENDPFPAKVSLHRLGPERLRGRRAMLLEMNVELLRDKPHNIEQARQLVQEILAELIS